MKRKQNQIAEGSSRRKLTQYHRWINERREQKSAETLRKWVIQEVEFGTVAAEMIHGLKHKDNKYHRKKSRKMKHKVFPYTADGITGNMR